MWGGSDSLLLGNQGIPGPWDASKTQLRQGCRYLGKNTVNFRLFWLLLFVFICLIYFHLIFDLFVICTVYVYSCINTMYIMIYYNIYISSANSLLQQIISLINLLARSSRKTNPCILVHWKININKLNYYLLGTIEFASIKIECKY